MVSACRLKVQLIDQFNYYNEELLWFPLRLNLLSREFEISASSLLNLAESLKTLSCSSKMCSAFEKVQQTWRRQPRPKVSLSYYVYEKGSGYEVAKTLPRGDA